MDDAANCATRQGEMSNTGFGLASAQVNLAKLPAWEDPDPRSAWEDPDPRSGSEGRAPGKRVRESSGDLSRLTATAEDWPYKAYLTRKRSGGEAASAQPLQGPVRSGSGPEAVPQHELAPISRGG